MEIEVRAGWSPVIEESELTDGSVSYFAFHPYIPSVNAHGSTPEEAARSWHEALALYVSHCVEHSLPKPNPNHYKMKVRLTDHTANVQTATDKESNMDVAVAGAVQAA